MGMKTNSKEKKNEDYQSFGFPPFIMGVFYWTKENRFRRNKKKEKKKIRDRNTSFIFNGNVFLQELCARHQLFFQTLQFVLQLWSLQELLDFLVRRRKKKKGINKKERNAFFWFCFEVLLWSSEFEIEGQPRFLIFLRASFESRPSLVCL
jgi:hypothetical protein